VRRREFITFVGSAAPMVTLLRATLAQGLSQVRQVGFLYPGAKAVAPARIAAALSGLQAAGWREPDQFVLLPRLTDGDPTLLAPMTLELVGRNVDLIMAISPAAVRAAKAATATIPIVANDLESDPVAAGFVASIAHPGGNITGVFLDFPNFSKKWLEALKEAVPQATKVAVLWDPSTGKQQLDAVKSAAGVLGIMIDTLEVRNTADAETTLTVAKQRGAGALVMLSSPLFGSNTKLFANLALAQRLPAVTLFTDFARDGGLMAYGPNLLAFVRQQGVMAGKILSGATPADLPVEAPTKFEFVLNLRTAKQLNLAIPASILLRADEVIE
jgi:ABC-type uncharacterized transport system substrate-binding protein